MLDISFSASRFVTSEDLVRKVVIHWKPAWFYEPMLPQEIILKVKQVYCKETKMKIWKTCFFLFFLY